MFDGPGSAPMGAAREDAGQWTADLELRAHLIFKRTLGPSWSVRAPGRSSQCGTRGFPGLPPTRNARSLSQSEGCHRPRAH